MGEAKFIRAFCHFYLFSLFQNIPLILTTDYRVNLLAFPATKDQIYSQLIADLAEAKSLLPETYLSGERIRPNKWAASAMLSRVYLYNGDWVNAENESSEVLSKIDQYRLNADLNKVFTSNNEEVILQFAVPVENEVNTWEGSIFILDTAPGIETDVILSDNLLAAFEPGDERRAKWVGSFTIGQNSWKYAFKYKIKSGSDPQYEYPVILRLAEQYLIRAEARIELNKIDLAIGDLNVIRKRARSPITNAIPNPLPDLSTQLNKMDALFAVEHERRIEFFSEWGHRWFDLKRRNRVDAVLGPLKSPNWQATDALYPIPSVELQNATNLRQNPGY